MHAGNASCAHEYMFCSTTCKLWKIMRLEQYLISKQPFLVFRWCQTELERTQQEKSVSISTLPEDVMSKQVTSFLTFSDIVRLDTSLTNRDLRNYLYACYNGAFFAGVVKVHAKNWCTERKCCVRKLRLNSVLDDDTHLLAVDTSHFEVLEVCATANVSEPALYRMLTNGKDFRILNIKTFYCMRSHYLTSLDVDLPPVGDTCKRQLPFARKYTHSISGAMSCSASD